MKLGLIVEGHGEVAALPVLLRRLASELLEISEQLEIPSPLRLSKGKMKDPSELRRAVELMARKTNPDGAILVLLDADDECPAVLGPELLKHVHAARGDRSTSVVVANREYESWFIAGASGLRGYRGLPDDLLPAPNAEQIRNAKGWIDERMANGYHETTDQPKLSSRFDLREALKSDSFSKLHRDIRGFIAGLAGPETGNENV